MLIARASWGMLQKLEHTMMDILEMISCVFQGDERGVALLNWAIADMFNNWDRRKNGILTFLKKSNWSSLVLELTYKSAL